MKCLKGAAPGQQATLLGQVSDKQLNTEMKLQLNGTFPDNRTGFGAKGIRENA